ncbi:MAG: D-alanyl-D-alanine carboxypeptidase, partial [Bdellovibrionales bacterium]|nr:D-alanyl-D-alanine carboxypeptidase [Bdellovibrionales bacterium]
MNMFLCHFLIFTLLCLPQFSWANHTNVKDWLSAHDLDPAKTGLQISSLRNSAKNWKWNQGVDLDPIAGKKVLIASKMLEEFPPGFQFETKLEGPPIQVEDQNVSSPFLCLKFGKDPWFDSERMWFLVNELTRTRIKVVTGDLFIDPNFQFSNADLMPGGSASVDRWVREHFQN